MADILEVQLIDVSDFTHGSDRYLGIEEVTADVMKGPVLGVRLEGELVPSSFERVGTDEGPVTFSIRSLALSTVNALADQGAATITFKARNAGQSAEKTFTMTGALFERSSIRAVRDGKGGFAASGKALTLTHD